MTWLPIWRCGYCAAFLEAVEQGFCESCGMSMGMAETPESQELSALRSEVEALRAEKARIRSVFVEWFRPTLNTSVFTDFLYVIDGPSEGRT